MACDYETIKRDNIKGYGTKIGRIGQMLLADRYDDRTHFIFELLQNTEDALARRLDWQGSRAVSFTLSRTELRITHWGQPFNEDDVRGICGIGESTKDLTSIGCFGIGFKSVYAYTSSPEIHSGTEDFVIEEYVRPTSVPPIIRSDDETIIILPIDATNELVYKEIANGLQRLGAGSLLFLRQIEEIAWSVEGGASGLYLRSKPEPLGDNFGRITVIGQEDGKADTEEAWLVCSREARTDEGAVAGHTEIAFLLSDGAKPDELSVKPVNDSPLVVFFPTVLQTHLGFLIQGPYRTTPSRDNVPRNDPWNQQLVQNTATLLIETLHWLRDHRMLNSFALRCLPLDAERFSEGSMFSPLFEATREALLHRPLLPRYGGGYIQADRARLARTQDLRELFDGRQLTAIFGHEEEMAWISDDITQDRTPELRQYLIRELGVAEITPEMILAKLDKSFFELQSDDWIGKLYEFLDGQPALRRRYDNLPLVRLEDGLHVTAMTNGRPLAFLPGPIETEFPTVRSAVCVSDGAQIFLKSLGLTRPDPVDDVVWNILPRYSGEEVNVDDTDYESDIRRILTAFKTDSKTQRDKLLAALREVAFVMSVDASDEGKWISKPTDVYIASERLKSLFSGVPEVFLVDDSYTCLRGEDIRELLEACGAARHLQLEVVDSDFTTLQRQNMRIAAGCESSTFESVIKDHTLRGLDQLLVLLPTLDSETRQKKAALLWKSLGDMADRRGTGSFSCTYYWTYYQQRSTTFDAAFVRTLCAAAWVTSTNGDLQPPELVVFDNLGWKANPFLQSKIHFKPPIIETLAREAGIDPGILDLLKTYGITDVADLQSRLGISDESEPEASDSDGVDEKTLKDSSDEASTSTPSVPDPMGPEAAKSSRGVSDTSGNHGEGAAGGPRGIREGEKVTDHSEVESSKGHAGGSRGTPGSKGSGPFISYLGVHTNDDEQDPDGLDQKARMALEAKAIDLILTHENYLERTPAGNPGFDLYKPGIDGRPVQWVEVKAMSGDLNDRPVGISRTQFECAREHGEAYWLYVVEYAGSPDARIVRIPNPAENARSFTFDHGWLSIADIGPKGPQHEEEDE
jgi:Protein NO VEIN, C-terminal